jgi:hypothetical protein
MRPAWHAALKGVVHNSTDVPPGPLYRGSMLSTLIVVFVVLWLLGITTAYTAGGLIHILLVLAVVVVLIRIIQGRNPIGG